MKLRSVEMHPFSEIVAMYLYCLYLLLFIVMPRFPIGIIKSSIHLKKNKRRILRDLQYVRLILNQTKLEYILAQNKNVWFCLTITLRRAIMHSRNNYSNQTCFLCTYWHVSI